MSVLVLSSPAHSCLIFLRKYCWFWGFSSFVSFIFDQIEFGLLPFFRTYDTFLYLMLLKVGTYLVIVQKYIDFSFLSLEPSAYDGWK